MRYASACLYLLLFFLFTATANAQTVNFEDGFEDSDFTNDPTWIGETDQFTVINGDPNFLLQLTADSDASPAYISAPLDGITGKWEFYVEYRNNSYSSSNQITVFLMSDTDNLEGSVNGYAIQVGESGDDYFELVRYDNGTKTTLLTENTVVEDDDGYKVHVTRDNNGNWEMQIAKGYSGNYNSAVTTIDNTHTNGSYFGPRIDFTSTRNKSFYFDFKIDLPPFAITETLFENNQVDVTFNRPYDQSSIQALDFNIDNGIGSPNSVTFPNTTTVRLNYGSTNFSSGEYTVSVNNVDDQNGETIADNTTASFEILPFDITGTSFTDDSKVDVTFNRDYNLYTVQAADFNIDNEIGTPSSVTFPNTTTIRLDYGSTNFPSDHYTVTVNDIADQDGIEVEANTTSTFIIYSSFTLGDIIINEFAYDYPPALGEEYVELKNTSDKYLNLADWQIADNNGSSSLGSDSIPIEPGSYLVISADTTELYNLFGNRAYHETGFPALNNTTPDAVQLFTDDGSLADSLTYNSNWGGTDVALERRSTTAPSTYQENWGDSPNPSGGTPGAANEVPADNTPPQLTGLNIISAQTLQLAFDERLDEIGNYTITNSSITSADQTGPETVELSLGSNLQNAQIYTLSIESAADIFSNSTSSDTSFTYYEPSPADSGDIAINEFMYAPPVESSEYIELYNHSDKSLDLEGWTVSDNRESFEAIITSEPFIVPPESFVVLAPDTLETNFPDISLITMSSFPALNNGGDAIVIRSNDDILLDSLSYTSDWGGDEIALERRSAEVAGTVQSNWGDAPDSLGTPGAPNDITPDTEPPIIKDLAIINNSELLLTFSESLDASTAENAANYSLSNNIDISNATFSAPDSVLLSLTSGLKNSTEYTLTVENVADLFGNIISPTDTSFTYYKITSADSGDVFINEFIFVPASGSTEFVEIYNPTSKTFNLQGWTLSDNRSVRSTITASPFRVTPGSYVVIAPDNTLLSDHPDINLVTMNSFPALNNSGDNIVIRNEEGALLDSLQFSSEWGGNEVSLERRTTSISGTYQENWGDASNGFGTPGKANGISVDKTPPEFEDLWTENATTFKLLFSEHIETSSITDSPNYQVSPHRDIQLISARSDTVKLFLDEELSSGERYEVTVSNISDIFGNTLTEASRETSFFRIHRAQPGDIVINEIMYKPGTGDADFVELYNASDKNFDLQNWRINDASGGAILSQSMQFQSGEFLVLTASQTFARQAENAYVVDRFPSLNNNIPDDIYLQTHDGRTIDSLRYEQSWGGNIEGISLERKDPRGASNDPSNWQTSDAENGYSAGTKNVGFQEDSDPPELIFSKVLPDENIEAQFSEFITLTDDVRFLTGDQPLRVIKFDSTRANLVVLSSEAAKRKASNSISITVQNLSDVKGNITSSSKVQISQPLTLSDLVINEIMFNPLAESDDNRPDQSEYIELRNTRDYAISLEGLVLHDEPDENGEVRELIPVSTTAKWVPPQGQVLIHADGATDFENSQMANFFELKDPDMQSVMRIDRSTLSLASTGDAIFIADSSGTTIDSVFYSEEWHNPNIIDTRGISLERVTPDGPGNDESNWGSSVNEKGGTPSSENSIYQKNANLPQEMGISFTPNPFSPDSDGHEDNLFINYKLDHQDYLIDVRVYDRYGRLVRELADGQQAGFEGQLIWDGRKEDNSRNRIGIYIVVFEAYDSTSGADQAFKETVVLARMLN